MRKIIRVLTALITALAMLISVMPVLADEAEDGHTYEYTGAPLDKECDDIPVSVDVTNDITVDGGESDLTESNTIVRWYRAAGGILDEAPSEAGQYYVMIFKDRGRDAEEMFLTSVDFVIWPKGHSHSFETWECEYDYINNDQIPKDTHISKCECGYIKREPHEDSEWLVRTAAGRHYKHCDKCDTDYAEDDHKYKNEYNDEKHWEECVVCHAKTGEENHTLNYSPNNDSTTHTIHCNCGYQKTEAHTFGEWHSGVSMEEQTRECALCGYTENRDAEYTVTYDYAANGGDSVSEETKTVNYNGKADLTVTATKAGWEFIGWSLKPDSQALVEDVTVTGNTTLYAVFRKTVSTHFYSQNNVLQDTIESVIYNGHTAVGIGNKYPSGLTPSDYAGWETEGWTTGTAADSELVTLETAEGAALIPDVTKDYYAKYSRDISLSYDTGRDDITFNPMFVTQYFNSSGAISKVNVQLVVYSSGEVPADFRFWAIGSKAGERHSPGDDIQITENTTVYALWASDLKTEGIVTYDYATNGGDSVSKAMDTVKYNEKADLTVTAAKAGWNFVGWSLNPDSEVLAEDVTVTGDITLYAVFKKAYDVHFYSKNGNIQTIVKTTVYNDNKSAFISDELSEKLNIEEYKINNVVYEGVGWSTETTAGGDIVDLKANGKTVIPDVTKDYYAIYDGDITLTYKPGGNYEDRTVPGTVRFNSAGDISPCQYTVAPIDKNNPVAGFLYWRNEETGEKYVVDDIIKLTKDTTLRAVYESDLKAIPISYDYKTNGGTSMGTAPAEVTEGETLDIEGIGKAVKAGWDFVGWNTDQNATEGLSSVTVTAPLTLYAIYKKTITAVFTIVDNNTEKIALTLYNNETEAALTPPNPISVTGWTFCGWEEEGDESGKRYSGAFKITGDGNFVPVYIKYISLVYDTKGASATPETQSAVVFKRPSGESRADIKLADAPVRNGYEFTGWKLSKDTSKVYGTGDIVSIGDNTVATAQWNKIELPPEKMTVTYDYKTNGGTNISATAPFANVTKGEKADLTFESAKDGWEFVGWNTDKNATEALTEYTVKENVTLYAIFRKDIRARFYWGETVTNNDCYEADAYLFNNDKTATVKAPEAAAVEGWTFDGWRRDKYTIAAEYKGDDITIPLSSDTDIYAVYSQEITVSNTTTSKENEYTQYLNTGGGVSAQTIVLDNPQNDYNESGTERFAGWEVTVEDENGEEVTTTYEAGAPVTLTGAATIRAKTIAIPEGATIPEVKTLGASVASQTSVSLSSSVTNDGKTGNEIIRRGFVYWSKLSSGTKYTVESEEDMTEIASLSPGTEYYYYAFAENAAGVGKGIIKSFATKSDDVPNAIMITPEYISVEPGGTYQLLATLLPDTAKNSGIVWTSADDSIATVDQEGKITGVADGQTVITATTEVGRLTAECIVDVARTSAPEALDFSEWHMASHTSNYNTKDGFDWDTADADGGNHQIATAYLARWEGAVLESQDAYPQYDGNVAAHYNSNATTDYHVQNIDWLPKRDSALDNDEIKSALMKYGAVYSLTCIDWDCYDDYALNYYCQENIDYGGHAVTIVGWDDNYSKDHFRGSDGSKPAGNGAFICKNSWGEEWGEGGYFYISYYDKQLARMDSSAVVTGAENNSNYNNIYQYDPLGAVGYIGYPEMTYAANVFPENGNALSKDESLKAVSFYTYQKNTSYDVYIVTNYTDKSSLDALRAPLASGVIENMGYHTVELTYPVELKKDTRFAVVVRFATPGEDAYVYCEYPVEGYSSRARGNEDESYFCYNGKGWEDLAEYVSNGNFCIKAFTDNGGTALTSAIDNSGRHYDSDAVYTLSGAIDAGLPINEDYAEFMDRKNNITLMSDGAAAPKAFGSIPSIVRAGNNTTTFTDGSIFPARYDLRDMGILSPVKNQGEWGTCWAHSIYASMESNIMRKQKTTSRDTENTFTLSRDGITMTQGSAVTLAKRIKPADLEDKSVVWLSSNEDAVTVDTNGTVRAVGEGTATVSAMLKQGGMAARCSVVVEDDAEAEEIIEFEESSVKKKAGDVFMVAYSVSAEKPGTVYSWVSDNTNAATVNANGVITAVADGTANISIMSGSEVKDTVEVIVGSGYNIETATVDSSGLTVTEGNLNGTVSVTVNNKSAFVKGAAVILTVTGDSGIAHAQSQTPMLEEGDNVITFENVEAENVNGSFNVNCYIWDSLTGMKPLALTKDDSEE